MILIHLLSGAFDPSNQPCIYVLFIVREGSLVPRFYLRGHAKCGALSRPRGVRWDSGCLTVFCTVLLSHVVQLISGSVEFGVSGKRGL